ncbi:hypothetical protein PR202_gb02751 [Eleusine coracana subsp. coracana]|uniref:Uncharacterized protein n=1 Tax=Eleusine coracana subsp. coracana TaxID=191504 RepID=A0AAV5DXK3_ELECO|nr:hypothetical protein PR202_gb02751 [Eleusine coracana subsp. coracana]
MAPTAPASEPTPSGSVQLLLRNIDSPGAGRCLPRDATLHVNSRLLSTPHPDAWNLASEVAAASAGGPAGPAASLDGLVGDFLGAACAAPEREYSTSPLGPAAAHVAIFLRSGAPGALGHLYLYSQHEPTRAEAERAIRRFLSLDGTNVEEWTAPVLLELCSSIASGGGGARPQAGHDDPLYADLRRALAALLDIKWKQNPGCWLDVSTEWVAEQLTRLLAAHKANAVMERIASAGVPRDDEDGG